MKSFVRFCSFLLIATQMWRPGTVLAKGYSSGGHSYSSHSSHSSSHSSGFSGSRSSGSGSSRTASGNSSRSSGGGGGKSWTSSGGKSYSSGSNWSDSNRKGYSSSKSYASGSDKSGGNQSRTGNNSTTRTKEYPKPDSGFSFDTAAARARKEEASRQQFEKYRQSQAPPPIAPRNDGVSSGGNSGGSWDRTTYRYRDYAPDLVTIRTRPTRIYDIYYPYFSRPWVYYRDPYSSFFWWWLLDRSLEDRAWWAYHHRYDMDPLRYDALLAADQQLQARVTQLEAQQVARDPSYVPAGLNGRDLMYSDQYVNRAYRNRSTRGGEVAFWLFGIPLAVGVCAFFIWLIWFKRWQTAT